jgi:hypothetical protein
MSTELKVICNCYSSCGCQNVVEDKGEDCDCACCTPAPLNAEEGE